MRGSLKRGSRAVPPAYAGPFDLPTRQSGAFLIDLSRFKVPSSTFWVLVHRSGFQCTKREPRTSTQRPAPRTIPIKDPNGPVSGVSHQWCGNRGRRARSSPTVANRKRIAARPLAAPRQRSSQKDAERDAESRKKEALREAKEKARGATKLRHCREKSSNLPTRSNNYGVGNRRLPTSSRRPSEGRELTRSTDDRRSREEHDLCSGKSSSSSRLPTRARAVVGLTGRRRKTLRSTSKPTRAATPRTCERLDAEAREQDAGKADSTHRGYKRSAAEHTTETTVSVVDLPSDDLKGRISAARDGTSRTEQETASSPR